MIFVSPREQKKSVIRVDGYELLSMVKVMMSSETVSQKPSITWQAILEDSSKLLTCLSFPGAWKMTI